MNIQWDLLTEIGKGKIKDITVLLCTLSFEGRYLTFLDYFILILKGREVCCIIQSLSRPKHSSLVKVWKLV